MNTTTKPSFLTKMKHTLALVGAVALIGGGVAYAQDTMEPESVEQTEVKHNHGKRGKKMARRLAKMTEALGLSDAQAESMKQIMQDKRTKAKAIRAKHNGDRKAAKPELKALRQETKTAMKAVLTPEQFEQFKQMRGKRGKHGKHGHRRLMKQLNLTDAQKTQWKAIHQDTKAQRAQILDAVGGDRKAAKPELRALRKEQSEKLVAILTPEQAQAFEAHQAKRQAKRAARRSKRGNK